MSVIRIEPVTRIEGHASIAVTKGDNGKVESAHLQVLELRGFEKLLEGMELEKMPLITGRICGVCPVAHHLASSKALDACYGTQPTEAAVILRRIMFLGHYIHSHALNLFVLAGPDILVGVDAEAANRNIVWMARNNPDFTKMALRLRTLGQVIVERIGGRGIHPVTSVPGGITVKLAKEEVDQMKAWTDEIQSIVGSVEGKVRDVLRKHEEKIPHYHDEIHGLAHVGVGGRWDIYGDVMRVTGPKGEKAAEFPVADYAKFLEETTFDDSYMKKVTLKLGGSSHRFRVGPVARLNAADTMGSEWAEKARQDYFGHFGRPVHHAAANFEARLVEVIAACEHLKTLLQSPLVLSGPFRNEVKKAPVEAAGSVEAPRGVLIHHYVPDEKGRVKEANLIVATQNNYLAIDETLRQAAEHYDGKPEAEFANGLEHAIRIFDPCLACATHAVGQMPMEVKIYRGGSLLQTIRRRV